MPYATRTELGWVIHGPIGPPSQAGENTVVTNAVVIDINATCITPVNIMEYHNEMVSCNEKLRAYGECCANDERSANAGNDIHVNPDANGQHYANAEQMRDVREIVVTNEDMCKVHYTCNGNVMNNQRNGNETEMTEDMLFYDYICTTNLENTQFIHEMSNDIHIEQASNMS